MSNTWVTKPLVRGWLGDILALIFGAMLPFALAPTNLWPISLVSAAALFILLDELSAKRGMLRSFLFGLGMFGHGVSWVYVAMHDFGFAHATLAVAMTSIFVAGLALVFALPFYVYTRYFATTTLSKVLAYTTIWVLGEWSRSWLLTGFPWLYVGYSQVDTWLGGWAPVLGVFGVSYFCVLTATLSVTLLRELRTGNLSTALICLGLSTTIWLAGMGLIQKQWGENEPEEEISIAIVQPNVPMPEKWNPLFRNDILTTLREESAPHWDKDLIVWPEAAIPLMYHDAQGFLAEIHQQAKRTNTGVITGILYDEEPPYVFFNSIIGLGNASGTYFKQRLVPFGEYVPLEKWLRGLIAFFDLPNSIIFPGPKEQDILKLGDIAIAPSICYEIVYPDLVARLSKDASLLVTISNDAWFGDSIGPLQHFQMARMRAMENQRYVVRSTNTGVSGIIDPKGRITLLGNQFERESIAQTSLSLTNATTPFAQWGSTPIISLGFASLLLLAIARVRQHQRLLLNLPD